MILYSALLAYLYILVCILVHVFGTQFAFSFTGFVKLTQFQGLSSVFLFALNYLHKNVLCYSRIRKNQFYTVCLEMFVVSMIVLNDVASAMVCEQVMNFWISFLSITN